MRKLNFLFTAAVLFATGNIMAEDQVVDLLPDGVKVNINAERKFVKEKNLVVAGTTEKGYKAFFAATDDEHGEELWVTDGTKEGTKMVKDINPGNGSSAPSHLAALNDKVLFSAVSDDGWGRQLYVSDGTEEGTKLIAVTYNFGDGNPQAIYQINETQAVFAAIDDESAEYDPDNGVQYWLWVTDGTEEGTSRVKEVNIDNPGKENTNQHSPFVRVGRRLFFKADDIDGHTGTELWVTDGTSDGTYLVKDINTEPNMEMGDGYTRDAAIDNLENFNDEKVFFKAWTMESGNELWCSDGTEEGTYEVYDSNSAVGDNGIGIGGSVFGPGWEVYKGRIWFRGYSPAAGYEFCGSNLEKGDYVIHDLWNLNPSVNNNSYPDPGCVFQNTYVFCAADGFDAAATPTQHGGKMWCFDGEKCWIQKGNLDIFPGTVCNWVKEPTVAGGSLYWMNEANDVALGLGSGLYRLDDIEGSPVVVTPVTSIGDNVHTLRNLAGDIIYVSGTTERLYVDKYTKPGWDGVSDAGHLPFGGTVGIEAVNNDAEPGIVSVYSLDGVKLRHNVDKADAVKGLAKGIYIVGHSKYIVK